MMLGEVWLTELEMNLDQVEMGRAQKAARDSLRRSLHRPASRDGIERARHMLV